jgi:two-component system cell cycle response regulator
LCERERLPVARDKGIIHALRRSLGAVKETPGADALTGLGNRPKLLADIESRLPTAAKEHPLLLILLDLEGFKAYNDAYGRQAGNALLARLGGKLVGAIAEVGSAYRTGGDEFCVLAPVGINGAGPTVASAIGALCEHGEGFEISVSYGTVLLPTEAKTPPEALRLADRRMYGRRRARRESPAERTDQVVKLLAERNRDPGHATYAVGLCEAVARKLGLDDEEMTRLLQAASFHDIGKAAIPDEILTKPGPLDEEEWGFIHHHSVIGERILSAAPALVRAAKLVRSTHERFDGRGYVDSLAGEDIPLGARIIAVCDAYDAMTSTRTYRSAMSAEGALSELHRCSGTQFDPAVVDAFCAAIAELGDPLEETVE